VTDAGGNTRIGYFVSQPAQLFHPTPLNDLQANHRRPVPYSRSRFNRGRDQLSQLREHIPPGISGRHQCGVVDASYSKHFDEESLSRSQDRLFRGGGEGQDRTCNSPYGTIAVRSAQLEP
jgi:hypothetical protein